MRSAQLVRLGDVCDKPTYGAIASGGDEHDGPLFIRQTDVKDGRIEWSTVPRCDLDPSEFAKYAIRADDLLIARLGSVGRSARVREAREAVYAGYLVRFQVTSPDVDPAFVGYQLQSPEWWAHVDAVRSGAVQATLNAKQMATFEFLLPEISVQRAIAEVLGALDDKIAANARFAAIARSLAEAEWLRARVRAPETVPLREVATLNYGKALPAKRRVPGGVQVVGSGGVNGLHDEALVAEPGIVVGRKGTAGAIHWLHGPHFPIDTTYFVTPTGHLTSHFLYYELKSMRLTEMNSDSAVPGLNRGEAYAAPVRHPEHGSMRRFNEVVPVLFDSIARMEAESESLATTRDALLPLLMSGKVTVKDAESVVEGVA